MQGGERGDKRIPRLPVLSVGDCNKPSYILLSFLTQYTGQFFRNGIEIDELRKLLLLPTMDTVPVMRKPVWHFMERETPEDQLCWMAMNPGYQGKRLIEGHYLDYLVNDVLSGDFKFKAKDRKL